MKHNFDAAYVQPTPSMYAEQILSELDYQLPFAAMQKLQPLYQEMAKRQQPTKITVLGSSYGMEAACLKGENSLLDLVARWSNDTRVYESFPATPEYQINFVDIQQQPLEYAQQVGLCDSYLVADMSQTFAEDLVYLLKHESDLVTGIGLAYYIGATGFRQLVENALVKGNAQALCYSLPNFHDDTYLKETCKMHGLSIEQLGDKVRQRNYANAQEQQVIQAALKEKGGFSEMDEDYITTNLYLIKRP